MGRAGRRRRSACAQASATRRSCPARIIVLGLAGYLVLGVADLPLLGRYLLLPVDDAAAVRRASPVFGGRAASPGCVPRAVRHRSSGSPTTCAASMPRATSAPTIHSASARRSGSADARPRPIASAAPRTACYC